MKIAVDGVGGDYAPDEIVKGCIQASRDLKGVEIVLVGPKELLEQQLQNQGAVSNDRIHIQHASEIITNEDKPVHAVRNKKDSSMVIGLTLLKEKEVDAFISAGNTGALLAGSLLNLGRIKGIDRPAIASAYLTKKGMSVLVDAGANAECKPRNLLEFGLMGSIYVQKVFDIANPSVGLVNIGTEVGKGTQLIKESFELFSRSNLNFYGNAEAREIPEGTVDVIVCDGFVGNVVLKLTEGVAITLMSMLKEELEKNIINKLAGAMMISSLNELRRRFDYAEYGGAPLLGINRTVIKIHGSSRAKAVKNAILKAKIFVEKKVNKVISEEISKIGVEQDGK
jgi:glycerol-3-phosphate acyltransferase PlsX